MTLAAAHLLYPPPPLYYGNAVPNNSGALLIDAAGEKAGWVFRVPKTGTLAKVRFRTGTVTLGDTLRISFQDVDPATGFPDNVQDQFRDQVIADADDNTAFLTGILSADGTDGGAKRAVTAGDILAVVIEYPSYVAGNMGIATQTGSSGVVIFPYCLLFTAATWAKSNILAPIFALEYSDGSYAWIPGMNAAIGGTAAEAFSNAATPDERGNLITPPFSCTAAGLWVIGAWLGNGDLILYDPAGAPLVTLSIDKDNTGTTTINCPTFFLFPTPLSLTAGQAYRLAYRPTSASNNTLVAGTYPVSAVLEQAEPSGLQSYSTTRTDAGAWTDSQLKRYAIGLILSAVDDGSGTGVLDSSARYRWGMRAGWMTI